VKPQASAPPWQPLTFGGVAAFAHGTLGRLLRVQMVVALVHAAVLLWFFSTAWLPVLHQTLIQLPGEAGLQHGQLFWKGRSPVVLGETAFLGLALNAAGPHTPGTTADLEILLTPEAVRFTSLLGHSSLPYPSGWSLDLSQQNATAWWQAWRRALFVGFLTVAFTLTMVFGWILGLAACWPVLLVGRLLRRDLTAGGAWRLAVAAGLPAGLMVSAAVLLYGANRVSLLGLLLAWVVHFLVLAVYGFFAPWRLPRRNRGTSPAANPFNPQDQAKASRRSGNPFAG
jgi:hypothetical protein